MAEDTTHDDTGADVGHDVGEGRTTAPMSEFTTRAVGIGVAVLVVGLLLAFVLPALAV